MLNFLTAIVVAAFLVVGIIEYSRLSAPLIAYAAAVRALTGRFGNATAPDADSAEQLGALADTATGAAVADFIAANATSRNFSARAIVNANLIAADVPALRRFETVPGQFIGAGLMMTFLLLAIAVSQAAAALSEPTGSLEAPMQELLVTAGSKFVVSIAAIFVSLVLVQRRTGLLILAEQALAALATTLDRSLPAAFDTESVTLARQQAATLERIEAALLLLSKPQTMLSAALGEAMQPVADSINRMGDRVATTNADSLERMVTTFTRELGGATLRYNEQLADILRETSDALRQAPNHIREAARLVEQLLDAAADKTEEALQTAGQTFTATADRLQAIADQARRAEQYLDGALDRAAANVDATAGRLAALTTGLDAAASAIAAVASTADAAAGILDDAGRTGAGARDMMRAETLAWSEGMQEVDRSVATILDRIRDVLPPETQSDTSAASPPPEPSPWAPAAPSEMLVPAEVLSPIATSTLPSPWAPSAADGADGALESAPPPRHDKS